MKGKITSNKDITNERFGKLIAIKPTNERNRKSILWECKCDCGNIIKRSIGDLNSGKKSGANQSCNECKQSLNLTGKKYGNLTAIKQTKKIKGKGWYWIFRCDCGNSVEKIGSQVYRKEGKLNCGCIKRKFTNKIDLMGKRFGKLKVISENGLSNKQQALWKCKCDCGNIILTRSHYLIQGRKTHCGCIKKKYNNRKIIFLNNTKISYSFWKGLKYGAKYRNFEFNITPEYIWKLFKNQKELCALTGNEIYLLPYYTRTASLDRINSNIGYVEGNLQWVHVKVNMLKMNFSEDDLIHWCKKIYEHNIKKFK
jgi:hypothetical protein